MFIPVIVLLDYLSYSKYSLVFPLPKSTNGIIFFTFTNNLNYSLFLNYFLK